MISLIFSPIDTSINVKAQQNLIPQNIQDINNVKYFIEFTPKQNGYSIMNYTMAFDYFNISGTPMCNVNITYQNPNLTIFQKNFNYNLSLATDLIENTSISYYNQNIVGQKTELFCNISNIGNPQKFRVDETSIFGVYLKTDTTESQTRNIDTNFDYIGIQQYNWSLNSQFNVYHYATSISWIGQGCS